jgi:uncharacterized membrane protein YbaN (DUF454 family)
MFLPGSLDAKDDLFVSPWPTLFAPLFDFPYKAFPRLQDWPNLANTFQKMVKEAKEGTTLPRMTSTKPILSLMQMAARNSARSKYLAIEENFLLAAIHVAALKEIPFAEGILPDLPSNLPSMPAGWDLLSP